MKFAKSELIFIEYVIGRQKVVQSSMDYESYNSVSWDECRRWKVSMQMWRAEKDCSRPERRRPGKLGCRRL